MALTPEQTARVQYLAKDQGEDDSEDEAERWADFDRVLALMAADELHEFVRRMNWGGGGADRLNRVLAHPLCDRGTALMIYWLASPTFHLGYETRERVRDELWPSALEDYDMLRLIESRFAEGSFASADIAYDPGNDNGVDRTAKRPRRKPIPIYGVEGGVRIQVNKDEPLGDPIDPRAALPAVMFEPVVGRPH